MPRVQVIQVIPRQPNREKKSLRREKESGSHFVVLRGDFKEAAMEMGFASIAAI